MLEIVDGVSRNFRKNERVPELREIRIEIGFWLDELDSFKVAPLVACLFAKSRSLDL